MRRRVHHVRVLNFGAGRIARKKSLHRVCVALISTRMSVLTATALIVPTRGGVAKHMIAIKRFARAMSARVGLLWERHCAIHVGLLLGTFASAAMKTKLKTKEYSSTNVGPASL